MSINEIDSGTVKRVALKPVAWPLGVFLSVGSLSPWIGPAIAAWIKLKTEGVLP